MRANGAVVLTQSQTKQLENLIFNEIRGPRQAGKINRDYIGKNAGVILQKIGMNVPEDLRLGRDRRSGRSSAGVDRTNDAHHAGRPRRDCRRSDRSGRGRRGGRRHTAVMHSKNIDNLSRMARLINCSIFVKNGPCYSGLGEGGEGSTSFTIASPTGEGMTDARTFSRLRRCVMVDHFRIV